MGEILPEIGVNQILSYCDDLVGVLRDKRDIHLLSHFLHHSHSLSSSSLSHFSSAHSSLKDYQKKIDECKQKIEAAKAGIVADEELDGQQKILDEELNKEQLLREELRVVIDEINELDNQRLSIEEQCQRLKKHEEEEEREQRKLSFYASVTKIIPDLESKTKIAGHIVERDKKAVEKFEFDPAIEDAFDICDKTWKMINR